MACSIEMSFGGVVATFSLGNPPFDCWSMHFNNLMGIVSIVPAIKDLILVLNLIVAR